MFQVSAWHRSPEYTYVLGMYLGDGHIGQQPPAARVRRGVRTYSYRYFFSNTSTDIHGIFTGALDQLGVAWRQNRCNGISIARREAVAALDVVVGPKG